MEARQREQLQLAMTALARGDRSAFHPVFAALWPLLRRFSERMLQDRDLAQDAAQTALMKLLLHATDFRPDRDVVAWALGFASFECLSARNRGARRREQREAPNWPPSPQTILPEEALVDADLRAGGSGGPGRAPAAGCRDNSTSRWPVRGRPPPPPSGSACNARWSDSASPGDRPMAPMTELQLERRGRWAYELGRAAWASHVLVLVLPLLLVARLIGRPPRWCSSSEEPSPPRPSPWPCCTNGTPAPSWPVSSPGSPPSPFRCSSGAWASFASGPPTWIRAFRLPSSPASWPVPSSRPEPATRSIGGRTGSAAAGMAAAIGTLGCSVVGVAGVLGLLAGLAAGTAPAVVRRQSAPELTVTLLPLVAIPPITPCRESAMKFLATFCLALSVAAAAPSSTDTRSLQPGCPLRRRTGPRQAAGPRPSQARSGTSGPDRRLRVSVPGVLKDVGEWIGIVAKCCQPLTYVVDLQPQPGGALWVRITGHDAKEFIGRVRPADDEAAACGATR